MNNSKFKEIVGKPQFHQSVFYTYNEANNAFYFYTPVNTGVAREVVPIGVFSPINRKMIPYDPSEMVEAIADIMSRSEIFFDMEDEDDNPKPRDRYDTSL